MGKLQARICTVRASRLPGVGAPPIEKGPVWNFAAAHSLDTDEANFGGAWAGGAVLALAAVRGG